MPLTLTIDKLVHGGQGLAHADGKPYFVSDVIPGETVLAEVSGRRGGCTTARPLHILEASPDRRPYFCRHAGVCGGCDLQHISPQRQTQLKLEVWRDCLLRLGKLELAVAVEVYPSPERGYRLRSSFGLEPGRRLAGFYRRSSNALAPIDSCPLLVAGLARLLGELPGLMDRLPDRCDQLTALCGEDDIIASAPLIRDRTQPATFIAAGPHRFTVRGSSFFQQNTHLLASLGSWPARWVSGRHCLDLYGGCGFFSVFVAQRFESGLLVEQEPSLVSLAKENFRLNGLTHFDGRSGSVEQFLGKADRLPQPDYVIVDPPRQGLAPPVREGLGRLAPAALVYVSCDPATQARDVGYLVKQCGYAVEQAALFDLYPNTHHLETALLLRRA